MTSNKLSIGDSFKIEVYYTQNQVIQFAKSTGDDNPIHLDNNYASKTIFGKTIIHGFLGGAIFSKIFGTLFPGHGTIYLKQSLVFLKPMYTEVNYLAHVEILEINSEKHRAIVKTKVLNDKNEEVITGEALILNNERF